MFVAIVYASAGASQGLQISVLLTNVVRHPMGERARFQFLRQEEQVYPYKFFLVRESPAPISLYRILPDQKPSYLVVRCGLVTSGSRIVTATAPVLKNNTE